MKNALRLRIADFKKANGNTRMGNFYIKLGLLFLLGFLVWGHDPSKGLDFSNLVITAPCFGQSESTKTDQPESVDIQWFRDEMKISSKYLKKDKGILGMSWTHFFTMLFLVVFFIAAMAALGMRQRRTKQILNRLLQEEEHGIDS
ncbi:MAG: hypothetical protein ACQEQ7_11080 [Thermodesulfobacteriota bacterium]